MRRHAIPSQLPAVSIGAAIKAYLLLSAAQSIIHFRRKSFRIKVSDARRVIAKRQLSSNMYEFLKPNNYSEQVQAYILIIWEPRQESEHLLLS
jgi:hypothetical protein